MREEWKDIISHNGEYKISNLGNVKSFKLKKELILKPRKNSNGYMYVNLCKEGKYKSIMMHKLVAISFLHHIPDGTHKIIVDHIDGNKLNNNVENLQLISQRENSVKGKINKSGYTGVFESKDKKKWVSKITSGKICKHLGTFDTKIEAHNEYLKYVSNNQNQKYVLAR